MMVFQVDAERQREAQRAREREMVDRMAQHHRERRIEDRVTLAAAVALVIFIALLASWVR